MNTLTQLRQEVDAFMGQHPQSPLPPPLRRDFAGLAYFDPDPAWVIRGRLTALADDEPPITMLTSTGDRREYRRWAEVTFTVDEREVVLTIYSDLHGGDWFIPFKDATNGTETYGAGRYLDNHRPGLRQVSADTFEIDFNYAYNPYCAYNSTYSCPLPPRENWLKVAIEAGEKDFKA